MNIAKDYYEAFHRINLPRLGAHLNACEATEDQYLQFKALQKKYWKNIINEVKYINHREIIAPSPWHAWAYLTALHSKLIDVKEEHIESPSNFVVPAYRGQANADFPPLSSLCRSKTNRDFEQNCLAAFSFIFNQEFLWQNLGIPSSENSTK